MNKRFKVMFQLSLRQRVILLSMAVLLCIIVASIVLINTIVKSNFSKLETTYTVLGAKQAVDALNDDIYYLTTICADWASWDDMYAYVENPNDSFKDVYLVEDMLALYNINTVVLTDSSGQIVFADAFDLDTKQPIPVLLEKYLTPGNILFTHTSLDSVVSGIVLLEDGPMLVTSQPILTSHGEGPIHGTIIMGRYLDDSIISQIEGEIQLSTSVLSITDPGLPENFQEKTSSSPEEIIVEALDASIVAGYAVVRDIYNEPALVLKIDTTRDIFREGINSTIYLSIIIVSLITVSMVIVILIIDRRVLRRVAFINNFVQGIGTHKDTSSEMKITGHDELSRLGKSISDMLERLNETKNKLQQSENIYRDLFEKSQQQYISEKDLREKLEEEIKKRTELSRALVHELKTPITPILAGLDLLQDEIHDEHLLQLVQSMDRSASNLNKRIDELLDLARAETNRLEIYVQTVDIRYLLQDIGHVMKAVAIKNGQKLVIDLPSQLPLISADGGRVRQAVENLLINSLKFTPAGGTITLKARVENDELIIDVIDTGRGINEEAQMRLFEPYFRHFGGGERLSGLGLGLVLSKNFIELHGGRIWVKSQEGKGSTFSFSLPLKADIKVNDTNSPGA